jgi:hypothetical protein
MTQFHPRLSIPRFEILQTQAQIKTGTNRELNGWGSGPATDIVLLLDLCDVSEEAVGCVTGTLLLLIDASYELMDRWSTISLAPQSMALPRWRN